MAKPIFLLALLSFFSFSFSKMKEPLKVVFFGDSITQAGVDSGGYINLMREMLATVGKGGEYDLIGKGISGNKVYDLYLRLEEDVLALDPQIAFIYIGVNDIWHKRTHGTGTDLDKFAKFYTALIKKMKSKGIRVVLCTPACIGEKHDCTNPQDGELNLYSQLIRDLASAEDCELVDLRSEFMTYNTARNPKNLESGILTTDGVHLNPLGNKMVAEKMLKQLLK
jgi:isoamyl acetate esterase